MVIAQLAAVLKSNISSCIADPDKEARAKENGGLTQHKDNPGRINTVPTTETKVATPTGSNMNRTLCKYCSVEVYVLTLNQTNSLMRLMVKEISMCLLTCHC